jgi:nucleotide-binding universal stress UspA family protein
MNRNVILCAIDLSASGKPALLQAIELARWHDAELHVGHVRGGRARRQSSDEPSSTGHTDQRLSSFMDAIDTDGLRVSVEALTGDHVTAVSDHAKFVAADLVVVARHGRRFGTYWRPGMYARVLPCPTLAVPDARPRDTKGSFVNILCPTERVRPSMSDYAAGTAAWAACLDRTT